MKRTTIKNKVIFRLLVALFTINISFCILPGGIIPCHGLFGEVTSSIANENQEKYIHSRQIKRKSNEQYTAQAINQHQKVLYKWLTLVLAILSSLYLQHCHRILKYITPVVLKVRMNN